MNRICNKLARNLLIRYNYNFRNLQTTKVLNEKGEHVVTEETIITTLQKRFPNAKHLNVEDVSGGCGAMFTIYIETEEFKGLSIPKQHRAVYDSLKDQIKNIHGLHLETKVPK